MNSFAPPSMIVRFQKPLSMALALVAIVVLIGCQPPETKQAKRPPTDNDSHAHSHDHDDHGPHGGHLIHLEPSGSHAEWTHDDDSGKLAIHVEEIVEFGKKIDSVKVELEIKGEPKKSYDFAAAGKGVYELVSPELLTAIEVGSGAKEKVSVKLVLSIDGKEDTASLEHHEHSH